MKKLLLLATLMILCLGLFAAGTAGTKDIVPPPAYDVPAPYDLMACVINTNDVQLCWSNPVYQDFPLGFRVYCCGDLVKYIPGGDATDCVVEDFCVGCYDFFVTAYFDSQTESPPSNLVEIMLTANDDNTVANGVLGIKAYPNPFRNGVNLSLANVKANSDSRLTIYNAKGQSVKTMIMRGNANWNWDATDNNGNRVPAGIYFAKAVSGSGSTLVKLMLTR